MLDLDPAPLPREVRLVGALREDPVLARARPRRRTTPARPRGRPTTAPRARPAPAASTQVTGRRATSRARSASACEPRSPLPRARARRARRSPSRSRSNSTRRRGDLAPRASGRATPPGAAAAAARRTPSTPPATRTISPSATNGPAPAAATSARTSGKYRPSGRPSRLDEAHRAVGRNRHDRAEPVPLRLVRPALAERHLGLELREHRSRQVAGDRALRHPPTLLRVGG